MNNLTQREKVLIYLIVGTLPVVLIFFGFNWFMGKLKAKSIELDAVTRQLADINLRADLAIEKTLLKNDFRQRSLAAQENVAQGEYREWLRSLSENEIKFPGTPKVTFKSNVDYKSDFGDKQLIFKQLSFQLDCQGSYKQIVEFLYRFYEKNYIHRISRLDLNLVRGKRVEGKVTYDRNRFNVKAQIQVLSLVDADEARSAIAIENTKLFYQSMAQDKVVHELEDFKNIVLRRNLFGFPNNPPDFGSRKKEFDFEEGDRISVRLSADDEDDDDLEYELESTDGKLTSDQIEQSRNGSFQLAIKELGSYEFKAKVTDKNYYPKTDDMLVVVNIEKKKEEAPRDIPPPKPKFDPLKFTYLEAIVRNFEGTPICWINVRPYGKLHKISKGETIEVGEKEVEVIEINRRNAILSIDGDHYVFAVNDALGKPQGERLASSKPKSSDDKSGNEDRKTLDVKVENPNSGSGKGKVEPPSPDIDSTSEEDSDKGSSDEKKASDSASSDSDEKKTEPESGQSEEAKKETANDDNDVKTPRAFGPKKEESGEKPESKESGNTESDPKEKKAPETTPGSESKTITSGN